MEKNQEKTKQGKFIILSLIVGFTIGYLYGTGYNSIPKSYNYLVNNPTEYIDYVRELYENNKSIRESCVADIDNCSVFIREKKLREKQFKDDPAEMDKMVTAVKENLLLNFSHIAPIEEFTIDAAIGDKFSTPSRQFKDTADVIYNFH